jgi:hypothetical protein
MRGAFFSLRGRLGRAAFVVSAMSLAIASPVAVQALAPGVSGATGGPPSCGSLVISGNQAVITCGYTGGLQTVTIPSPFDSVQITAYGAEGGVGPFPGGYGGESEGTLSVTPGEVFTVMVGGIGGAALQASPGAGGYGGGGSGGTGPNGNGAGGGGGSFVWDPSGNLIMAAGGGGGTGFETVNGQTCVGGGGGLDGQSDPCTTDGTGGGQSGGGTSGGSGPATWNGGNPQPGQGGNDTVASSDRGGGGGGGGYFGGGAVEGEIQGGGGGSGYLSSALSSSSTQAAVNSVGNGYVTFSFAVSAPSFSAGTCVFIVDVPSSCQLSASGTPTPSWSESSALPFGVYFVDNGDGTATLTGTAYATGTFPISVTASNLAGSSTQNESLVVGSAPSLIAADGTTFDFGSPSSYLVATTGYPTPAISETGALPAGVSFVDNGDGTATLAGNPTASGLFPLTLTAQSAAGTVTQNFVLAVDESPSITSAPSADFPVGTSSSFTVSTTAYPTASLSETGPLPSGFTFTDNGDGTATITGDPTAPGTYPITVQATSSSGSTSQNLTIYASLVPAFSSAASASFPSGSRSSFTVTTAGYPAPSLSESGALPTGISFSDNGNGTATLSGTSTETGTYRITITATSPAGSVQQLFTLVVFQAPKLSPVKTTELFLGQSTLIGLSASGYPAPSLSLIGKLPSGLRFAKTSSGHATISGHPIAGGIFPLEVKATNAHGSVLERFQIVVFSLKLANPGTLKAGASDVQVSLFGSGFDKSLAPSVHGLSAGFKITDLVVKSVGVITFRLSVSPTLRAGKYRFYLLQYGKKEYFTLTVTTK